jgi:hypothetical protein
MAAQTECKHHWSLPCSSEDVILANCRDCEVKQYQSNAGMAGLKQANELNKKNGFPLIELNHKKEKENVVVKEKNIDSEETTQPDKKMRELEKLKAAIIADYNNPELPVRKMLRKYHISTARFQEIKKLWNIPSKGRHSPNQSKSGTSKPKDNQSADNSASSSQKTEPQVVFTIPIVFQFNSETVAKLVTIGIAKIIEDACNG